MDNSFTFGDYYKDIKFRRAEHPFLFKVDKIITWKKLEKLLKAVAPKREQVAGYTANNRLSMFRFQSS